MVEIEKTADKWFGKLETDVTKKISAFVAFFFILIAIGIWAGITVARIYPQHAMIAVLLTAAAGLVAYFSRAFAIAIFVIMLILVFIL